MFTCTACVHRLTFSKLLWYAPQLGIVVKEELEWTNGEHKGKRSGYTLKTARLADGTSALDSTPPKPPAVIASVPEQPIRPVTQPTKPTVDREALLEAGEYVAPEIGTGIEYSNWACTVQAVDGFSTKCRFYDGTVSDLYGQIEIMGDLSPNSYFAERMRFVCGTSKASSSTFKGSPAKPISSLWPIKVGQEAQYNTFVFRRNNGFDIRNTARVEERKLLDIDGRNIATFVISITIEHDKSKPRSIGQNREQPHYRCG